MIENKFARLKTMYKDVLPVKGWTYYDTISVKWRGQVVATRFKKDKRKNTATFADSIDLEANDVETMNAKIYASSGNTSSTNNDEDNNNKQNNKTN